jgi:hypothetical protein
MRKYLFIVIVVLSFLPRGTFAQDAKPTICTSDNWTAGCLFPEALTANNKSAAEVSLNDETEKLKIQVQLLLQDNAALRKQLAQANAQLAEVNEQGVSTGGSQLLKQLAEKHGLRFEDYDFTIDPKSGEMKFVRKADKK